MKIGITERGDPSIDYSWKDKINNMDGVIFITKNLTNRLIDELTPYFNKIIVHITCTGYGGTVLEPNIPEYKNQIQQAVKLVNMGLSINQVVIRVDPVIPTHKGLKRAQNVIEYAHEFGFNRFRVSLIDMYPHVRNRFVEHNLPLPYHGGFSPSTKDVVLANKLIDLMKKYYPDITVESCAEKLLTSADAVGCVSEKDLQILGLSANNVDSVGYQRKGCLCCSAKTELLSNKHQCPYKCLYCYWKNE